MNFSYEVKESGVGFGISLESILKNRGIENIKEFLNPSKNSMEDEGLYDNIDIAADKLLNNIKRNKNIIIIVDCDADGFTSAAMLYQYILVLIDMFESNSKVYFIVHDDKKHGLDEGTLNKVIKFNPDILLIPDAGSNDYDQHKLLNEKGIEIIVLDHHESNGYSNHATVVNNQLSSKIKNKTITGAGVVYKFIRYIDKLVNINIADNYLDLLSIGMIADSCDLRNIESRFLTLEGLKQIQKGINKNKLITAMVKKKSYDMKNKVTITGISFYIAPLINSIIRNGTLNDKELMFKAFVNSDERYTDKIRGKGEVKLSIQDYVVRIAEKCKRKQVKLIEEGVKFLSEQINEFDLNKNGVLIVNGTEAIDPNYTGLIANKLSSFYQKPCLLLRGQGDRLTGSGRGFEKKSIKDFKDWCNNTKLFEFAEGHSQAFGVAINKNNINKLYGVASNIIDNGKLIYNVDGIFTEKTLNKFIIESISKHDDIWGTSVTQPIFAIENINVEVKDIDLIGAKKTTIKFKYKDIEFIKFKSSEEEFADIKQYTTVSFTLIGKFGLNTYNGNATPQITIETMSYKEGVSTFRF